MNRTVPTVIPFFLLPPCLLPFIFIVATISRFLSQTYRLSGTPAICGTPTGTEFEPVVRSSSGLGLSMAPPELIGILLEFGQGHCPPFFLENKI